MNPLEALADAVGPANLFVDPADIARYDADGRRPDGRAAAVVRPGSTAEVAAVVRAAAAAGLRIVPQGARTGLVGAGLGDGDVVLSLERMARPPVVDPLNRSVEADAGVLLSTLNAAAAAHGLVFPIDLGADPSVGGMVSANTGGARFLRYGDVRRNLLAVEVVLGDGEGTVIELGGPLWKNNAGLDLKQLCVGGSGSLGIVTRATLALQPKPAVAVAAMLALRDPAAALAVLVALEAAWGTLLTAFEGMSGTALGAAFRHVPRLRDPFGGEAPDYAVLIELSTGTAIGEEMLEDMLADALAPFMEGEAAAVRDVAVDRGGGLWAIRHAIPEGLRAAGQVVACDIALRRGDVMRFRGDVATRLAAAVPQLVLHDFGHIGDGGMHFNLVWPAAAGPFDAAAAERARAIVFAAAVEDYGGSFSAEHGIGPRNAESYRRFASPAQRRLAGAVQKAMAPVAIGRVDFGMGEGA